MLHSMLVGATRCAAAYETRVSGLRGWLSATAVIMFVLCAGTADAQRLTNSGFYYPVQPRDGYTTGYHMLAGMLPVSSTYGGHFMSPSSQRTDPQTSKSGKYFYNLYHNGFDVMANYGTPVYSIGEGVVKQLSYGGWSNGGTTNMAVIIMHTLANGQQFRALYGHLEVSTVPSSVKVNAIIPAGMIIGKVGTWVGGNHLHFGVNIFDVTQPLPFTDSTNLANVVGYGRIGINYWTNYWPDRMNWVDPVFFIETQSPNAFPNSDDLIAKSDMKQYMVAKVDSKLITDNGNFGFIKKDQYYEYRYQWFYKSVSGQIHYVLVNHATYINNRSVRFVIYEDWDTKQVYGWFQIIVVP
jgi:murein DD-endopeptidase MepM/ murein hydrolase activator NlpD